MRAPNKVGYMFSLLNRQKAMRGGGKSLPVQWLRGHGPRGAEGAARPITKSSEGTLCRRPTRRPRYPPGAETCTVEEIATPSFDQALWSFAFRVIVTRFSPGCSSAAGRWNDDE